MQHPLRQIHGQRTLAWMLVLLCMGSTVKAQTPAATLRADKTSALIGDPITLQLLINGVPAGWHVQFPPLPDSLAPALEVTGRGATDSVLQGPVLNYRQNFTVSGFDSGVLYVPALPVSVTTPDGSSQTLYTAPLPLLVQTVPVDTTKPFRPIKEIIAVPENWWEDNWMWVAAGAAAVLLILILVLVLRRKKPAPTVVPPPAAPPETLAAKALRQLQELDKEALWQSGEVKEYYSRLTEIIRNYISAAFGIAAPESTTGELLAAAAAHPTLGKARQPLEALLQLADMAKFARARPELAEHLAAMEAARDTVKRSAPFTDLKLESLAGTAS